MRQRRLKDLDNRMAAAASYWSSDGEALRGQWVRHLAARARAASGGRQPEGSLEDRPLYLEIGCGKGKFLTTLAERQPEAWFLGAEGNESVLLHALEKAEAGEIANIYFYKGYIRDIRDLFAESELDGIYLNFSDPWPKNRHAKRRLTSRGYLEGYADVVRPGGFLAFKTDDDGLFAYSVEMIRQKGYDITELTDDLHASIFAADNIMTEYEERFVDRGKNIHYLKVVF